MQILKQKQETIINFIWIPALNTVRVEFIRKVGGEDDPVCENVLQCTILWCYDLNRFIVHICDACSTFLNFKKGILSNACPVACFVAAYNGFKRRSIHKPLYLKQVLQWLQNPGTSSWKVFGWTGNGWKGSLLPWTILLAQTFCLGTRLAICTFSYAYMLIVSLGVKH